MYADPNMASVRGVRGLWEEVGEERREGEEGGRERERKEEREEFVLWVPIRMAFLKQRKKMDLERKKM